MKKSLLMIAAVMAALIMVGCEKSSTGSGSGYKPGSGYTPGGNQNPGGNEDQGGTQNPGGNEDQGGTQNPGGNEDQGGTQNPGGNEDQGGTQNPSAVPSVLTVTPQPNAVKISYKLTSGSAPKAYIIKYMRNSEVTVDLTKELQFISYLKNNGTLVNLPYSETVQNIPVGFDLFTAAVACDANGNPVAGCSPQYTVWTPIGQVAGWSTDNNPGSLGEVIWQ